MNAAQPYLAAVIFCALVGLAVYYGRQQFQTFARLRSSEEIGSEERRYLHRQAWRRLINSGLMFALAVLVAGYYLTGLEARVTALGEAIQAKGEAMVFTAEQQRIRVLFGGFCISILSILMAMVFLVAFDVWAIRRYSRQFMKQLNAERRAMIEGQVAKLRAERNGHPG